MDPVLAAWVQLGLAGPHLVPPPELGDAPWIGREITQLEMSRGRALALLGRALKRFRAAVLAAGPVPEAAAVRG